MITVKDVRTLARTANVWNEVNTGKEYALVWRAVAQRVDGLPKSVERRFLIGTKPEHISWWIGGAHHAYESVGYTLTDEELAVEQV